jgi:probable rRNA maturation factor
MTDAAVRQPISITEDDDDADSIEIAVTDDVMAMIVIEDARWHPFLDQTEHEKLVSILNQAMKQAMNQAKKQKTKQEAMKPAKHLASPSEFTVMLTNDAQMAVLNQQFRQKAVPTNVLSFPDHQDDHYLGDIAIGYDIMTTEATATDTPVVDHFLHLLVHGILHLLGFDHIDDAEAHVMETAEKQILASIGIADPYEYRDKG